LNCLIFFREAMKTVIKIFAAVTFLSLFNSAAVSAQVFADNTNIKNALPENAAAIALQHGLLANVSNSEGYHPDSVTEMFETRYRRAVNRLKEQAAAITVYAKANNYNCDYCFLVDMSIPSGKNRFFVYNIKKDSIESSSLVAHGFGSTKKDGTDDLIFSNNAYSFKTSLGKYKIGGSYNGTYGLAYKLYGLDSTNSKAYERAIVLHADQHVPSGEIYPARIFQSAGCPTVAPSFLPFLGNYIGKSKKPVLMWIYN